jgi:hypothetical protein
VTVRLIGIGTECVIKNALTKAVKRWRFLGPRIPLSMRAGRIEKKTRKRKGRSIRYSPQRLLSDLSFRLVRRSGLSLFCLQMETVRSNRDAKSAVRDEHPSSRHLVHVGNLRVS